MAKYLNPKVDLTFKKIFGEHKNLVMSLLNALLPLPEDMKIVEVEYLTLETIPDTPMKKHAAVDVRCTDNSGRGFIVEMQSYWTKTFFARSLFNAASMYTKQLKTGNSFNKLKAVYCLALINDNAFDYSDEKNYIQEFYFINKNNPEDIKKDISLIFVELTKYKPLDKASKAIKELWLRFLTEINEDTTDVDSVMLENPEINQALNIVEKSAYSDVDMYEYEDCLLDILAQQSTIEEREKQSLKRGLEQGLKQGKEQGLKQGKEEGLKQGKEEEKIEIAKNLKKLGISISDIQKATNLPIETIEKI